MMEGKGQNHEHLISNSMLLRNVFKSCNADLKCDDYADEGYSCANAWNCHDNNTIITGNLVLNPLLQSFSPADGKGLIDVRSADDFTLDLSDSQCPEEDQICCKRPNFR